MSLINLKQLSLLMSAVGQKFKKSRGNWNQNDPTADDYIKNRPFYEDKNGVHKIDEKYLPESDHINIEIAFMGDEPLILSEEEYLNIYEHRTNCTLIMPLNGEWQNRGDLRDMHFRYMCLYKKGDFSNTSYFLCFTSTFVDPDDNTVYVDSLYINCNTHEVTHRIPTS